ncbi:MAG: RimK family alpha-L-glutamate ligase [Clostridia bacterium]|nr:RimK family alpha-L-glutamate ligase [Clostridia bacterium]
MIYLVYTLKGATMKVALITNGFFVNQKTEEIRELLAGAFLSKGVILTQVRNSELIAGNGFSELKDVDAVLFWDKDVLLARHLENEGRLVINSSSALQICDDKALSAVVMAKANLPMPKTILSPFTYANIGFTDLKFLDNVIAKLSFPIVIKETHGSFGQQVYLARDYDALVAIVQKIAPRPMIFQQYIECGNSDLRLQVVGDKVVAAVKRESKNGDFRANATLGGIMTAYTPTSEERDLAIAAAKAAHAEIAGVDILQGDKPYLCEVNANAHFKRLMDATGIDVADLIAKYVMSRA